MAAASTVCGRSAEVVLPPHLVVETGVLAVSTAVGDFTIRIFKDASGLHFSESEAQSAASVEEHVRYLPSPRLRGKGGVRDKSSYTTPASRSAAISPSS